jgi:hypothetical protein
MNGHIFLANENPLFGWGSGWHIFCIYNIPVKLNNRVTAVENPTGSGNHD